MILKSSSFPQIKRIGSPNLPPSTSALHSSHVHLCKSFKKKKIIFQGASKPQWKFRGKIEPTIVLAQSKLVNRFFVLQKVFSLGQHLTRCQHSSTLTPTYPNFIALASVPKHELDEYRRNPWTADIEVVIMI